MGTDEPEARSPRLLDDYVGQDRAREHLRVAISAARMRRESLDHVLLLGPPGLGKTTLAHVIANEMGVPIRATSGPLLRRPGDVGAILTNLGQREVLFIDELDRMNPQIEEILCPAVKDFELDIVIGRGSSARAVKVPLQPFTLIGETTRPDLVRSRLRSRFGIVLRLEPYSPSEIEQIILRSPSIMSVAVERSAIAEIARQSLGVPHIAFGLLRRIRDFADVHGGGTITAEVALHALTLIDVDAHGTQRPISGTPREPISDETRTFVWQRDRGSCVKCGSQERLEFDHIIPLAEGGSNTARNLQLLCESCNRSKGATI